MNWVVNWAVNWVTSWTMNRGVNWRRAILHTGLCGAIVIVPLMTGGAVEAQTTDEAKDQSIGKTVGKGAQKGAASAASKSKVKARPVTSDLLTFIRALEAPRGYDDYERRIKLPPPKRLTAMTIGEVLQWQELVRKKGFPSTAAGGYQIIFDTLSKLVRLHKINRNALFNAPIQDRIARLLIGECGNSKKQKLHRRANCLAGIWAALPITSGPQVGRSAYEAIAGNRALTTPKTVLALLAGNAVPLGPIHHAASSPRAGSVANAKQRRSGQRRSGQRRSGQGGTGAFLEHKAPPLKVKGAIPSFRDINAAMRGAALTGTLSPSVQKWNFDPYAVE